MAINFNVCREAKSGNIITAKGRLSYPELFRATLPKGETDQKKAKFQTSLVFPDGADLNLLAQKVEEAAVAEWGKDYKTKHKIKKPFLKVADYPKMSGLAEKFSVFIRTSSPTRPQIVDHLMNVIGDDKMSEVYPGRWAVLSVRVFTYNRPDSKGVSLGLQNVQLFEHDEPLGGVRAHPDDEFEAVEGVGAGTGDVSALFD